MGDEPLDDDLVAAITARLRDEPSDHLRQMLAADGGGHWSPEAVRAARLILDRRAGGAAAEPVVVPVPAPTDTPEPSAGGPGEVVLAPGFCAPRGFAWLAGLGRVLGRSTFRPARLGEVRGRLAFVYCYDGARGWVRRADVRPFPVTVGRALVPPWRRHPGVVTAWRPADEAFRVRYPDGQGEWVPLAKIIVPRRSLLGWPPDAARRET
jgi:hypothetical protein